MQLTGRDAEKHTLGAVELRLKHMQYIRFYVTYPNEVTDYYMKHFSAMTQPVLHHLSILFSKSNINNARENWCYTDINGRCGAALS
jgi:hypothetical protein